MGMFRDPGQFCWLDIKTADTETTKRLYKGVFGWKYHDEVRSERTYTTIRVGKDDVGGLTDLRSPIFPEGTTTYISAYVAVASVDDTASRAVELGGTMLLPPFDVPEMGRMATLQDPTGAVFSVWEARPFRGMSVQSHQQGAPGVFLLMTSDMTTSGTFYTDLFQWTPESVPSGTDTTVIFKSADQTAGAMMPLAPELASTPAQWCVAFSARNCETTIAHSEAFGATRLMNGRDTPGIGRLGAFRGPDGITCFVIEPPR